MRRLALDALLVLGSSVPLAIAASDSARPRGIGPEFAKFYKSSPEPFPCIFNPSIQIDASRINDDYCDCPDGSDEPGTAACGHISRLSPATPYGTGTDGVNATAALPGFYCKNKGHRPGYVPFTAVNDGVCDYEACCDGSDEWGGVGGIKCPDRCGEIGKEWRRQDELRQKALGAARQKRKELVDEAGRVKKEVEDRIETLKTQIEGAEMSVSSLEKELRETERRERGKMVRSPGEKKGGKWSVLAGLAKERMGELKDNLQRVRGERDLWKERVKELEDVLSKFKEEYNPNFNDEGVKRAVRSWEDYAAREKGPAEDAAHDRDLAEMLKSDEENGIKWAEWEETSSEDDIDVLYQIENYLPAPIRQWVDQKLRDLRLMLMENGILADNSSGAGESQAVKDAKTQLKAAEKDLEKIRKELKGHQEDLDKDYGPDGVFRAIKGQCLSQDSGEYTYELCWMEKATQKPKKGGAQTNMGKFARIETVTVDEDLPADGRGLGSGKRYALKMENGQHCWNGPNRSTTVILACAEKDEIWKITEEEKCVYRMEVGTPAVCGSDPKGNLDRSKDEL
ncbi:glucosidase II beta subunit-like protein-domain-containing protein [Lineolata rhizophorae]|uniref:Glucosidase 2 subunit beta n=1 Tax=Lineolata rhizophorae TaxID=578093 RepID=A0A6A6P1K0_9PEZI|nr:glucosidase II beta subunit-like protein-domain-containing protein [Lineolata rhizophorae]